MQNKQAVLTFNPKSGKGKATLRARDFADHWKKATGNELRLRATRSLEDIRLAARESIPGDEIQIFMGGDGTLSESIQGLAEHNQFDNINDTVGFLPGGTGNSFLRDFGITNYEEARDALLDAILNEQSLAIDAALIEYDAVRQDKPAQKGELQKRIMFNIWGIGLVSDITVAAIKMRGIGDLNYKLGAIKCMGSHKMYRNSFQVNQRGWEELDYNLVSISNSRYTGGAMKIAPGIRVNDGQLFMLRSAIQSRLQLFQKFPSVIKGDYKGMPRVYSEMIQTFAMRSSRPVMMNVDGELESGWDPRLHIMPSYFKIYMPQSRQQFQ